jgi:uncharacterized glyoxalase superfamily protein PhnB
MSEFVGEATSGSSSSRHASPDATGGSVIWLNLSNKDEVDEPWRRWRDAGAKTLELPDGKPWKLREFLAADGDGNQSLFFCDFSRDLLGQ